MPNPLESLARQYAAKYGIDPDIFARQIRQESGFNINAVSPKGARGIAQFMPETGRRYGLTRKEDFHDPDKALDAGARLMRDNLKRYGGDYAKTLAAYNAGEGAVDKYGGVPPYKETQNYVKTILGGKPSAGRRQTGTARLSSIIEPNLASGLNSSNSMPSSPSVLDELLSQQEPPMYRQIINEVMGTTGIDEPTAREYLSHPEGKKKYPVEFMQAIEGQGMTPAPVSAPVGLAEPAKVTPQVTPAPPRAIAAPRQNVSRAAKPPKADDNRAKLLQAKVASLDEQLKQDGETRRKLMANRMPVEMFDNAIFAKNRERVALTEEISKIKTGTAPKIADLENDLKRIEGERNASQKLGAAATDETARQKLYSKASQLNTKAQTLKSLIEQERSGSAAHPITRDAALSAPRESKTPTTLEQISGGVGAGAAASFASLDDILANVMNAVVPSSGENFQLPGESVMDPTAQSSMRQRAEDYRKLSAISAEQAGTGLTPAMSAAIAQAGLTYPLFRGAGMLGQGAAAGLGVPALAGEAVALGGLGVLEHADDPNAEIAKAAALNAVLPLAGGALKNFSTPTRVAGEFASGFAPTLATGGTMEEALAQGLTGASMAAASGKPKTTEKGAKTNADNTQSIPGDIQQGQRAETGAPEIKRPPRIEGDYAKAIIKTPKEIDQLVKDGFTIIQQRNPDNGNIEVYGQSPNGKTLVRIDSTAAMERARGNYKPIDVDISAKGEETMPAETPAQAKAREALFKEYADGKIKLEEFNRRADELDNAPIAESAPPVSKPTTAPPQQFKSAQEALGLAGTGSPEIIVQGRTYKASANPVGRLSIMSNEVVLEDGSTLPLNLVTKVISPKGNTLWDKSGAVLVSATPTAPTTGARNPLIPATPTATTKAGEQLSVRATNNRDGQGIFANTDVTGWQAKKVNEHGMILLDSPDGKNYIYVKPSDLSTQQKQALGVDKITGQEAPNAAAPENRYKPIDVDASTKAEPAERSFIAGDKPVTVTDPESIAAFDAAKAKHDRAVEVAKGMSDRTSQGKAKKAAGLQFAADKRKIANMLTLKEAKRAEQKATAKIEAPKLETVGEAFVDPTHGEVREYAKQDPLAKRLRVVDAQGNVQNVPFPPGHPKAPKAERDIVQAVRDLGGMKAVDRPGEVAKLRESRMKQPGVFTKTGESYDNMARRLHEEGYLDAPDVNEMFAKLDRAASGERLTARGEDEQNAQADKDAEAFANRPIDEVAHDAATSSKNDTPIPTEAQKEAGNYKKGHVKVGGLEVSIENPAGTKRRAEWGTLKDHYGYIKRTEGADGEQIDVFVKPGTSTDYNGKVFVVDQVKGNGQFDEHKALIGFADENAAREGYSRNYTKDFKVGKIREFANVAEFRAWLKDSDTTKPATEVRTDEANKVSAKESTKVEPVSTRPAAKTLDAEAPAESTKITSARTRLEDAQARLTELERRRAKGESVGLDLIEQQRLVKRASNELQLMTAATKKTADIEGAKKDALEIFRKGETPNAETLINQYKITPGQARDIIGEAAKVRIDEKFKSRNKSERSPYESRTMDDSLSPAQNNAIFSITSQKGVDADFVAQERYGTKAENLNKKTGIKFIADLKNMTPEQIADLKKRSREAFDKANPGVRESVAKALNKKGLYGETITPKQQAAIDAARAQEGGFLGFGKPKLLDLARFQSDKGIKGFNKFKLEAAKNGYTDKAAIAKAWNDAQDLPPVRSIKDLAIDVANVPRSLQSSFDLSAPLRQGAILSLSHPSLAFKAGVEMVKALKKTSHEKIMADMEKHPAIDAAREADLYLSKDANSLGEREEAFMSQIVGKLVAPSERAYTTYLDKLRLDAFGKFKESLGKEATPQDLKDIAKFINSATGRGEFKKGGALEGAAPILNGLMFSPRYLKSRIDVLNPVRYKQMTPAARKIALTEMARYVGVVGMTLAMAKLAGAEVNVTDPESSDWLKIKVGDTKYDVGAGLQQLMRFSYRFSKSAALSATGKLGKKDQDALAILGKFARSKEAPSVAFAHDVLTGKDFIGRPTNTGKSAAEHLPPLFLKDLYEAYREEGLLGVGKTAPGVLGVGTQTFKNKGASGGNASALKF